MHLKGWVLLFGLRRNKTMDRFLNVNLQEGVPEHILRTGEDDNFSSESDKDGEEESQVSSEEEDMLIDHGEEFETNENSGWADAMSRVLNTSAPKGKETIVLAKAKKLTDIAKKTKEPDFEIDCEIKEEKPDVDSIKEEIEKEKKNVFRKISKREWRLIGRVKPSILDKNREKTLAKIATKGVVQLFNSVQKYQKNLDKKLQEAGTFRQKEKILKSVDKKSFLDMLMGPTSNKQEISETEKTEIKEEDKAPWKALREDFMMGGSLKDWDKTLEESNPSSEAKDEKEDISVSEDGSSDDG